MCQRVVTLVSRLERSPHDLEDLMHGSCDVVLFVQTRTENVDMFPAESLTHAFVAVSGMSRRAKLDDGRVGGGERSVRESGTLGAHDELGVTKESDGVLKGRKRPVHDPAFPGEGRHERNVEISEVDDEARAIDGSSDEDAARSRRGCGWNAKGAAERLQVLQCRDRGRRRDHDRMFDAVHDSFDGSVDFDRRSVTATANGRHDVPKQLGVSPREDGNVGVRFGGTKDDGNLQYDLMPIVCERERLKDEDGLVHRDADATFERIVQRAVVWPYDVKFVHRSDQDEYGLVHCLRLTTRGNLRPLDTFWKSI